ncbi:MAG: 3-oxoacyl-ACP synthase III [Myxococcales bacterium]|nr:3-oxoacyl-ACP synthase III [Myxococcales bacterium]MDH3483875.1 3-oxoacyl-ACP synthase III [Myxococcales bacterium]
MRFENVAICSVAHVDARDRVTSTELEAALAEPMHRLGIPRGILRGLTGIVARRMWDASFQPSEAATAAAEVAIERAGVDRGRLGILINTSVCRDYIEPSTAALVHRNLGLGSDCVNFDLGNACLGFLSGMEIVGNMIERRQIDYGIVVDGENSRYVVSKTLERLRQPDVDEAFFRANFATLTLGSGGAAMMLGRSDLVPHGHRFVGSVTVAATEHNDLCHGQVDQMQTKTRELLVEGIKLAKRTWDAAKVELGWSPGCLDEYVLHQVSKAHTEKLAAALELEHEKILTTYEELGNVGPAAVPIVLSKAVEAGRVQSGNRVGLLGIGSGLNCSMAEVVW